MLLGATAGTARHSLALEHALRPLFAYLRAVVLPTAVFAASEDWAGSGGADQALAGRIDRAAGELADLVAGRPPAAPGDPFADPTTSFEELLRGSCAARPALSVRRVGRTGVLRQPTASGDGGAEPPCGASAVMIRTISARSAADGRPQPGS